MMSVMNFQGQKNVPVYDREMEIVYDILDALKMDDVMLDFDDEGIVATDDMDNEWHGIQFYEFLSNEAFVFDENGHVSGISETLFRDFAELARHYGVRVRDNRR